MEGEGRARDEIDSLTIGSLKRAAIGGDMEMGAIMMGQAAGMISDILSINELLDGMMAEACQIIKGLVRFSDPHTPA